MALDDDGAIMTIAQSTENGETVIHLAGEMDLSNVDEVRPVFETVVSKKPARIVVDLGELKFMDSSGIALLVEIAQRVDELIVENASELILRILAGTGVSEILRFER